MARAQTCPRTKAPLLVAGLSDLWPVASYGTARADLPRRYCHPGVEGYRTRRRPRQALPFPINGRGLQQPLVVAEIDGQMVLIDGRNRRLACEALRIVPDYVLLDGQDPMTYILSANIHRRHMTKSQRAIVVATLLETSKVPQQVASKQSGLSQQRISQARTVLHHAPDLADQVLNGSLPLDKAYEEVRIRKGRAET
jgi:ParB-like chromosome segregation protein Spo0J